MRDADVQRAGADELHARLLAVMEDLRLPSPERMLNRIESMLPRKEKERVLRQLLDDFQKQSPDETKRILRILAPSNDEWVREVERLISSMRPGL